MKVNKTLIKLDLSFNKISNIDKLYEALLINKTLKEINLFETLDRRSKVSKLNLFFQGLP